MGGVDSRYFRGGAGRRALLGFEFEKGFRENRVGMEDAGAEEVVVVVGVMGVGEDEDFVTELAEVFLVVEGVPDTGGSEELLVLR